MQKAQEEICITSFTTSLLQVPVAVEMLMPHLIALQVSQDALLMLLLSTSTGVIVASSCLSCTTSGSGDTVHYLSADCLVLLIVLNLRKLKEFPQHPVPVFICH